jgi:hypothetical protein
MAKEKEQTTEKKEKKTKNDEMISNTSHECVFFSIGKDDLKYMGKAFREIMHKTLDPETVTTGEIRQLVFHNTLWDIPKSAKSGMTTEEKDLLKAVRKASPDKRAQVMAAMRKLGIVAETKED